MQSTLDCFIAKTMRPKVGSVSSEEELHGENSESESDSGRLGSAISSPETICPQTPLAKCAAIEKATLAG